MKMTLTAVAALMIAVSPLAAETPNFISEQNQSEVLGTDFVGTQVVSKDNQPLGKIANLVFDLRPVPALQVPCLVRRSRASASIRAAPSRPMWMARPESQPRPLPALQRW